jgi:hypothetical protein
MRKQGEIMVVGDIVILTNKESGKWNRFYEIKSICYGVAGQEDLIELKSLTESPGVDSGGNAHLTTWVPEPLVRGNAIYTREQMVKDTVENLSKQS